MQYLFKSFSLQKQQVPTMYLNDSGQVHSQGSWVKFWTRKPGPPKPKVNLAWRPYASRLGLPCLKERNLESCRRQGQVPVDATGMAIFGRCLLTRSKKPATSKTWEWRPEMHSWQAGTGGETEHLVTWRFPKTGAQSGKLHDLLTGEWPSQVLPSIESFFFFPSERWRCVKVQGSYSEAWRFEGKPTTWQVLTQIVPFFLNRVFCWSPKPVM